MDTKLYERLISDFYKDTHPRHDNLILGLMDECTEVANANTEEQILDELGDVLWYVTIIAQKEGSSLEEIMKLNYNKLELRALNGKV